MKDLRSPFLIIAKGILFFLLASLSSLLLFAESPHTRTALLLLVLVWASARAYYFSSTFFTPTSTPLSSTPASLLFFARSGLAQSGRPLLSLEFLFEVADRMLNE